ncbi:MAG: UbiA family prenyltransferase [Candidatus Hermodarchaeota archaeon]
MSVIKDISDLLRISLCFLASIVIMIAGYLSYRLNGIIKPDFRPQNFVEFILKNEIVPLDGVLLGLIVPFSMIAGTHVINDYFDYSSDVLNHRFDRPLVRGSISLKMARNIAIVFYFLALLITIIEVIFYGLSPLLILCALFFILLGVGYNLGIKDYGIIGNIWVSLGYVAPFLMGTLLIGILNEWVFLNIIVICFFILFLALGREVLKDIMDIEGDLQTGKRSVAISLGPHWAARISGFIYCVSIFFGFLLLFLGFQNNLVFFTGFIILVVLLFVTTILLIRKPTLETAIKGRKYTRWSLWWATALIYLSSFFI